MSGRTRSIWIKGREEGGVWLKGYWAELDLSRPVPKPVAPMIMRDVEPYRSVITREVIGGRAQHREHLKAHGCVEVGNEFVAPRSEALPPLKHEIERALQASPEVHAEARVASERASGHQ